MNNTINVPRELLERTIDRLKYGHEHDKALRELRAILATAKSAAADDERMRFDLWAEQQGWPKDHTMLHELWLAWKAGALKYAPSPAGVDGLKPAAMIRRKSPLGTEYACEAISYNLPNGTELCRLSDAQAIIDGLRWEVDQQAQRIGELEGLLMDVAGMFHGPGIEGGPLTKLRRSLNAALYAGKDSGQ